MESEFKIGIFEICKTSTPHGRVTENGEPGGDTIRDLILGNWDQCEKINVGPRPLSHYSFEFSTKNNWPHLAADHPQYVHIVGLPSDLCGQAGVQHLPNLCHSKQDGNHGYGGYRESANLRCLPKSALSARSFSDPPSGYPTFFPEIPILIIPRSF